MSVNIELHFTVSGIAVEAQAQEVEREIRELLRDEGIENQVGFGVVAEDGAFLVTGESQWPLIITRFYLWQPKFEKYFDMAVKEAAPDAKVALVWGYPDEE
ncbi:hypothetical protein [Streptomyces sp. NPDC012888]|uniref:hypothetical protein n=1 Tax=Streptomyces sp. NPDC012888 TaxID=3364855 RepID=UPI0036A156E7